MIPVFDLFSFVRSTYVILWRERAYLARLAAVPLLIMTFNMVAVTMADETLSPLRRGLFLLPGMAAESWLVIQFLRTLMTGERWPMRLSPDAIRAGEALPPALHRRVRGLLSGMTTYLLITVLMNAVFGTALSLMPTEMTANTPMPPALALGVFATMIFCVAEFRLFWIYIPLILNMPARRYLILTQAWPFRIQMIGLWLSSTLPLMAVMILVLSGLIPLAKGNDIFSFLAFVSVTFLSAMIQSLMAIAGSVAISLAVLPFLTGKHHVR